jgi:streptogramin lyase
MPVVRLFPKFKQGGLKNMWRSVAGFLLAASVFIRMGGVCAAQPTNILEFPITGVAPADPARLTFGPDGAFWFAIFDSGYIGRIDTVSNVITYVLVGASPFGIVTGPDNNLWFTEAGSGGIGRITTVNSNYTDFPLQNSGSQPLTLIVGPDKRLWFIEFNLSKIAAVNIYDLTNADGTVKLQDFGPFGTNTVNGPPGTNASMYGLVTGPDNNIWFTQGSLNAVGNINTNGTVTNVYQLPFPGSEPSSIASGPDGALWFTEFLANKIGRITTNGAITEFSIPCNPALLTNVGPYGIVLGPDGNLWFSEFNNSSIGRITPGGVFTIFPTPTVPSYPTFLATNATSVWFGEFSSGGSSTVDDHIGLLVLTQTLSLNAGILGTSSQTFSGSVASFLNSNPTDTVTVAWGDGTSDSLTITNAAANASTNLNTVVVTNSVTVTNSLTISNTAAIGTNGNDGAYTIIGVHNYTAITNFPVTITVTDSGNDVATASVLLRTGIQPIPLHAAIAAGNVVLSWPGTNFVLLSATNLAGPWSVVPGASSPYTNLISGPQRFFELKSN